MTWMMTLSFLLPTKKLRQTNGSTVSNRDDHKLGRDNLSVHPTKEHGELSTSGRQGDPDG